MARIASHLDDDDDDGDGDRMCESYVLSGPLVSGLGTVVQQQRACICVCH